MPLLDNDRHPNVSLLMSVECHVDTRRTANSVPSAVSIIRRMKFESR